jgi:hypothetical protein
VSKAEGNSGSHELRFHGDAFIAERTGRQYRLHHVGGTAVLGSDFQLASGTLTYNPGETQKQLTVLG